MDRGGQVRLSLGGARKANKSAAQKRQQRTDGENHYGRGGHNEKSINENRHGTPTEKTAAKPAKGK